MKIEILFDHAPMTEGSKLAANKYSNQYIYMYHVQLIVHESLYVVRV